MKILKATSLTLATLAILAIGHGLIAQPPGGGPGPQAGEQGRSTKAGRVPVEPAIKALIEARIATARGVFEGEIQRYENALLPSGDTSAWSLRWLEEQLHLDPAPAEKLAAIRDHLERVKRLEELADNYARNGQGRFTDALRAKYFRLEAEQMLAEARAANPDVPLPAPKAVGENRKSIPQPLPPPAPPR